MVSKKDYIARITKLHSKSPTNYISKAPQMIKNLHYIHVINLQSSNYGQRKHGNVEKDANQVIHALEIE